MTIVQPLYKPAYGTSPAYVRTSDGARALLIGANIADNVTSGVYTNLGSLNAQVARVNIYPGDIETVAPNGSGTDWASYLHWWEGGGPTDTTGAANLAKLDAIVSYCDSNSIMMLLETHQSRWGFYAGVGAHGGIWPWYYTDSRFPGYAISSGIDTGSASAAQAAWWTDTANQVFYIKLWQMLVARYSQYASVIAYGPFNEPEVGSMGGTWASKVATVSTWLKPIEDAIYAADTLPSGANAGRGIHIMGVGGSKGLTSGDFITPRGSIAAMQAKNLVLEVHGYFNGSEPGGIVARNIGDPNTPPLFGYEASGNDFYPDGPSVKNTSTSTYAGSFSALSNMYDVGRAAASRLGLPLFLGEFGSNIADAGKALYESHITQYLTLNRVSGTQWSMRDSATGQSLMDSVTDTLNDQGTQLAGILAGRSPVISRIGSTSSTNYTDSTASAVTTYSYTVTAVDAAGNESDPSAALLVTTPPGPGTGGDPVWFTGSLATGTTSASATPPGVTQSGDIMLCQVTTVGAAVSSAPSGWSLVAPAQTDSTRISHAVYKKTAGSSETSAYTWSASGAATTDAQITTTRNATLGGVISTGSSGASDNSHTLPTLSGLAANDVALAFVADDSSPIFHPRTGCTLGCMPDGSLSNWSDNTALASFETLIGRKVHYSHSMIPWDVQSGSSCTIPTRALDHGNANIIGDYNLNRISYFSWPRPRHTSSGDGAAADWTTVFGSGVDPNKIFDQIVAGTHDTVITHLANGIKNWEHLVVLRLFWEPNDGMPWSIKTSSAPAQYPAKYIAACRYIIAKILAVTTNVWFHFNPQLFENQPAEPASTMYWGDDVVTYAGQEWYLNPATGTKNANQGETFASYQNPIYNLYVGRTNAQGQPMVFGAGEGNAELPSGTVSGGQAFCYQSVGTALPTLPQFKFLTQWDNNGVTDSRLSVSPASALAAYKTLVGSTYMQPALTDTWLPVSGWKEEYQTRHPLGNATARTNYGAGQQGHGLWSKVGSAPSVTIKGGGLGRWGGIVVQLIGGGSPPPPTDTTGPTLTTSPSTDTTYPSGTTSVTFSGTVSDPSGVASVKINGTTVTVTGGAFSKTLTLATGTNTVTVVATDASPNQNQTTRTLTLTVSSVVVSGTKVAFVADFGPSTISSNVIGQIPTDSSLAYVINGGDNYDRGVNDAATPTNLTTEIGYFATHGLIPRLIGTPGNHDWCNRNIQPAAGATGNAAKYQGFFYCWQNANGLAAGNAGNAGNGPVVKTINGWTIIIVNTVITSTSTALDQLVPDTACGVGSAQLAQIQAALPSTRKAVVFGHHPRWNADDKDHTDGTNGTSNMLANMQSLWAALQGCAIAYVSGHAHNMQIHQPRDATGAVTAPDSQGNIAGVTQIIAGSAGGLNYSMNNSYKPAPVWTDGNGVPGLVLFDFSSTSQVGVQFIGSDGTVLKAVNLV